MSDRKQELLEALDEMRKAIVTIRTELADHDIAHVAPALRMLAEGALLAAEEAESTAS